MWSLIQGGGPWRRSWWISDDGANPAYGVDGKDIRLRALKSASPALTITETPDHILLEATGGPGGSPLDAWPVGSVYIAVDALSPATRFGGGTWAPFGAGRVLVARDAADVDFDTPEETGGAKTVTLTSQQMPIHTHLQDPHTHVQNSHTHPSLQVQGGTTAATAGTHVMTSTAVGGSSRATTTPELANAATAVNQNATAANQNAGGGLAHSNVQPYIVVFMWKRTA